MELHGEGGLCLARWREYIVTYAIKYCPSKTEPSERKANVMGSTRYAANTKKNHSMGYNGIYMGYTWDIMGYTWDIHGIYILVKTVSGAPHHWGV